MNETQDAQSRNEMEHTAPQWAEIIEQFVDGLTGKGASISYTFDNLAIDIPRAQGPNRQDLGSAKWTVNGKVIITAETLQSTDEEVITSSKPVASASA